MSNINLRSCLFVPGPVLTSDFIYLPVTPPHVDTASDSSRREVGAKFNFDNHE